MKSKIRNRVIIILVVTIAGFVIVFRPHHKPSLKDITSWSQIKQNLSENIHLGLDLRGGSHLVMQVQTDEVVQKVTQRNAEVARAKLQEKNLPFTSINGDTPGRVLVEVPDTTKSSDIVRELKPISGWIGPSPRGELDNGFIVETKQNELREKATEQAMASLRTVSTRLASPSLRFNGRAAGNLSDSHPNARRR
jgi:preprotein translocase subunit SecD